MSIATVVCGVWSLTRIFSVVLAGGVGKNGSTVAVSFQITPNNNYNNKTSRQIRKTKKKLARNSKEPNRNCIELFFLNIERIRSFFYLDKNRCALSEFYLKEYLHVKMLVNNLI